MPGIFGFSLHHPNPGAAEAARRLSQDLCLFEWQRGQEFEVVKDQVFLGLAWNESEPAARGASQFAAPDVTCVVDGYIVRTRQDLGAGPALAACQNAEVVAQAYRKLGEGFAAALEGPFTAIVFDHERKVLLAATERHGLSPLYRHTGPEATIFCSVLGPMARCGLFPARIDHESAATHLGHNHLFYRQSMLEGVTLQDAATVASVETGGSPQPPRKYWYYGQEFERDETPYRQRIDDLCDALVAATDRILDLPGRLFTSLSGGLDSRLMTGLALRQGASLEAWTFGDPASLDMQVAQRICQRYEVPHHTFQANPDDIRDHAPRFATILNGSGPMEHAHALSRCHATRTQTDRIINGYRGGVVLGSAIVDLGASAQLAWWKQKLGLSPRTISPYLEQAVTDEQMTAYYHALSHEASPRMADWTVSPEPPLGELFTAALAGPLSATPREYRLEQWSEEFGGGRTYTLVSLFADRHFYADASIFYDYDVRDLSFVIAPQHRRGNKAYVDVMKRLIPELARETYANSGVPAVYHGYGLLAAKAWYRATHRQRMSTSTGLDASAWLRLPSLRDFAAGLIGSDSFQSRSWWNGAVIAGDFDAYQAGQNGLQGELWNAITLELFARQWIDTSSRTLV